ncbi:DUF3285 domain-containing protein [Oscillatoria sp. FACHB-1407]|uniref:DUF3285 domain-containing protein n=1 Tax=Oscillatoria sp. FACHB-1407 TaxID=2692847 RepID=UPI0016824D1B|nr:DUF3285 domain-containing protein [Oscillatoria sp. FACHB-1407]MBD2463768.1 DUF3285 domain-containing protein [Oscillatoria sp. FACHB-1407]
MSNQPAESQLPTTEPQPADPNSPLPTQNSEPQPSYVKLAMRNMVRKRGKSLYHFTLTTVGLLAVLVGLAYLTR